MTTQKSISLDFVNIEFHEPDVVIYHYRPKIHLTWAMVQQVAEVTNKLIDFTPCFMCAVIGSGITIEKEVREYGSKPEMLKYTKASAIVQNSLAHRIIANFIIQVQRPPVPTKSFESIEDALTWFDALRIKERAIK